MSQCPPTDSGTRIAHANGKFLRLIGRIPSAALHNDPTGSDTAYHVLCAATSQIVQRDKISPFAKQLDVPAILKEGWTIDPGVKPVVLYVGNNPDEMRYALEPYRTEDRTQLPFEAGGFAVMRFLLNGRTLRVPQFSYHYAEKTLRLTLERR
jgi:hypothetical protein